mmetsp:Transcript_2222/g.4770  ORF Transcript_2222/g.4770 Transcript_2222/m.4770 type:complete len:347 (-) Transcript_2222:1073-2113(-)
MKEVLAMVVARRPTAVVEWPIMEERVLLERRSSPLSMASTTHPPCVEDDASSLLLPHPASLAPPLLPSPPPPAPSPPLPWRRTIRSSAIEGEINRRRNNFLRDRSESRAPTSRTCSKSRPTCIPPTNPCQSSFERGLRSPPLRSSVEDPSVSSCCPPLPRLRFFGNSSKSCPWRSPPNESPPRPFATPYRSRCAPRSSRRWPGLPCRRWDSLRPGSPPAIWPRGTSCPARCRATRRLRPWILLPFSQNQPHHPQLPQCPLGPKIKGCRALPSECIPSNTKRETNNPPPLRIPPVVPISTMASTFITGSAPPPSPGCPSFHRWWNDWENQQPPLPPRLRPNPTPPGW